MKRYKVVDTSAFQKLNMKPGAAVQAAAKGPPRMVMAQYHPVNPVVKHNARAPIGAASAGLSARDLARDPVGTAIGPARPGSFGKVNPSARVPSITTKKPGCGGDCGCAPCSGGNGWSKSTPIGGFLPPASCIPGSAGDLGSMPPPDYPASLRASATFEYRLTAPEQARLQSIIDYLNLIAPLPEDGIDPMTGLAWRLFPLTTDDPTWSAIVERRDQAVVVQFERRGERSIWSNTAFWDFVAAQDADGLLSDLQRELEDSGNPLVFGAPAGSHLSGLVYWLLSRTAAIFCVFGLTNGVPATVVSRLRLADERQGHALGVYRAPGFFLGVPPEPLPWGPTPEMLFPDRPLFRYAFECPPGTVPEIQWLDDAQPYLAEALRRTNESLAHLRPPVRTAEFYNAAWQANFRRFYCPGGTSRCPGGVFWGHVVTQLIPRTRFLDPDTGESLLGFPTAFDRTNIGTILRCPPDGR